MRSLKLLALALMLAGAPLAVSAQPQAERPPERGAPREEPSAEALAREAVEKLVQALTVLLRSLPQYEMPVINEDGDIIIRRVRPKSAPAPTPPQPPHPHRSAPDNGIRT